MLIMKSGKRETVEGIELQNQENIITVGEKENHKYLGILKAETIKQKETKEKNKSTSDERESFSKPPSTASNG